MSTDVIVFTILFCLLTIFAVFTAITDAVSSVVAWVPILGLGAILGLILAWYVVMIFVSLACTWTRYEITLEWIASSIFWPITWIAYVIYGDFNATKKVDQHKQ
jgi:hypothetical protein